MLILVRSIWIFMLLLIFSDHPQAQVGKETPEALNISADFYAVQTNLMPYKGYQNDLSVTLYAKYSDYKLVPFVRYLLTNYYYLMETIPVNNTYTTDRRTAAGGGLDYQFNQYIRVRFMVESIHNKLSNTRYTQESYGLIYNQYIDLDYIELNAYLESFLIPRVAAKKLDTFAKVQAFKSIYLSQSTTASNVIYPFIQAKIKVNDDVNFGVSGHNASAGAGYKFYGVNESKDNFSLVLEGHSVFYQSRDFKGDAFQILAALQLWID